jgi:NRPS condensation-like uncharacterized protein
MPSPRAPTVELPDVGLYGAMDRYGDIGIHAVIDLARTFSKGELERAMAATLADFPVLDHRYVTGLWRDRWLPVAGPVSDAVHVEDTIDVEARTAAWVRRPLDATRERQLRLVALTRPGGQRIVLTITHLAVDGAGIAAVGHVLGAHLYGVRPAVPVEPRRDVWHALEGLRWFHWLQVARGLASAALRPIRQYAAAPRERPYPAEPGAEASWRHVVVPKEHLEETRRRCANATVNDVLIAAFARVAGGRSSDGPVVVTYTMDLRRYGKAARLTAANTSSILSAIVPRHALTDLETAARAVSEVTARDRENLAGPAFLLGPYALAVGAPHGLARGLVQLLSPAMVDLPLERGLLVTNVGRIDDGLLAFGEDLQAVRIVGPSVRGMPVPVVVAFGFRGALHLELFAGPGLGERALDELEREIHEALGLTPT